MKFKLPHELSIHWLITDQLPKSKGGGKHNMWQTDKKSDGVKTCSPHCRFITLHEIQYGGYIYKYSCT